MTEYKIDKSIPIPTPARSKYPFHELSVGESFFVAASGYTTSVYRGVQSLTHYYSRGSGKKFVMRSVDGGVRVWRTE